MPLYDPACQACALGKMRKMRCVQGDGNLGGRLLALAQAPGRTEDTTGVCLTGRAGSVTRKGLELSGLWGDVYLDNCARCWPPSDREPTAPEVKACSVYTAKVFDAMPKLEAVIAFGNVPLLMLTGRKGVMKKAGKAQEGRFGLRTFPVIPIPHPAYVLRNASYAETWLSLLKGVKRWLDKTPVPMTVLRGRKAAEAMARFSEPGPAVAFDLETTGLDPERDSLLCVSFFTRGLKKPVVCWLDTPETLEALRHFFGSLRSKIVHHVAFECSWAEAHLGVVLRNVVADTRILSHRIDENMPADLHTVVANYVPKMAGYKLDSEAAMAGGESWNDLTPKVIATRCGQDSQATYLASEEMFRRIPERFHRFHPEADIPIAMAVARMGRRGLRVDLGRLDELEARYVVTQKKAQAKAKRYGIKANLDSPLSLSKNIQDLGYDTGVHGKTSMSTSEEALLNLIHGFPETKKWADAILLYREAGKLLSTYVKGLRERLVGDMIYSRFLFPGTVTWRLASRDPNLQNIPIRSELGKDFRSVFVSRFPGGSILAADYKQAELWVLAMLSGDDAMIEAFVKRRDIHGLTAERAFGRDFTKGQRYLSKTANFALIYGAGPTKLAYILKCTEAVAQKLAGAFQRTFPGAWRYMLGLRRDAEDPGAVIPSAMYGISRHLPIQEGYGAVLAGANAPIQTTAVLITLTALARLEERLPGDVGLLVCQVHDEIVLDVRAGKTREAIKLVRQEMAGASAALPFARVPLGVDIDIGKSWKGGS